MGQSRSLREILNMHWTERKWKYNTSKLWKSANTVVRGNFIASNTYTRQNKEHSNNLSAHHQKLEIEGLNGLKQAEINNKVVRNQ